MAHNLCYSTLVPPERWVPRLASRGSCDGRAYTPTQHARACACAFFSKKPLHMTLMHSHANRRAQHKHGDPPLRARELPPEDVAQSPSGDWFVKLHRHKGILPEILEELLAARKRCVCGCGSVEVWGGMSREVGQLGGFPLAAQPSACSCLREDGAWRRTTGRGGRTWACRSLGVMWKAGMGIWRVLPSRVAVLGGACEPRITRQGSPCLILWLIPPPSSPDPRPHHPTHPPGPRTTSRRRRTLSSAPCWTDGSWHSRCRPTRCTASQVGSTRW